MRTQGVIIINKVLSPEATAPAPKSCGLPKGKSPRFHKLNNLIHRNSITFYDEFLFEIHVVYTPKAGVPLL